MTGKTHKFLGIVAGSAIAYYGIATLKEPLYILAITSSSIGAMIADIDHNRSRLGNSRKQIIDIFNLAFRLLIFTAVAFYMIMGYLRGSFLMSLLTLLIVMLPFFVLFLLTRINFIKSNLKFITKHRGLFHTLILPLFICAGTYIVDEPVLSILLKGLLAGYLTHLFADLLTVRGCPILFPISKRNFNLSRIKTGSVWEYISAVAISLGIVCIVIFL